MRWVGTEWLDGCDGMVFLDPEPTRTLSNRVCVTSLHHHSSLWGNKTPTCNNNRPHPRLRTGRITVQENAMIMAGRVPCNRTGTGKY